MFADLKPYPEYRDSGVGWLSPVPSHWDLRRMRFLLREIDRRSISGEEQLLRVSQYTGVTERRSAAIGGDPDTRATSLVGYKRVAPGDLVINIMLAWNGSLGVSRYEGIVSPAYCVYRFSGDVVATYYHDLLRSPAYRSHIKSMSTGVVDSRLRLYSDRLYGIEGLVPSVYEQAAIVKYLGHANARIDRAIAAKRKLIALLDEQKQAIINQAVTRGLDPNVPMKDSGIPWLGQIPAHWPVAALRQRYSQSLGKMLDSSRIVGNDLLPYLRNTDVQWDRINMVDLPEMDIPEAEFDRYTLEPGDLLVCEGGDVGRAAIWGNVERVGYQKALHRLRPGNANEDVPRYLLYGLRVASKTGAFSDGHVSTIAHLTGEKLRAHRFAWPSAAEQQSIVDHLDSSTAATNRTIDRVSREIELLREFRTRLTADVVTGQLDIRDSAALLPELDPADLVSDAVPDEDELDEVLAESLEEVDA